MFSGSRSRSLVQVFEAGTDDVKKANTSDLVDDTGFCKPTSQSWRDETSEILHRLPEQVVTKGVLTSGSCSR